MAQFQETHPRTQDVQLKWPLSEKDIEFFEKLQFELNTQDSMCQHDPRFWVIKASQEEIVSTGVVPDDYDSVYLETELYNARITNIQDLFNFICRTISEQTAVWPDFSVSLEDNSLIFEQDGCKGCIVSINEDTAEVLNDLQDDIDFVPVFVRRANYIVPNTLFLTHKQCEKHLKLYEYRYPADAHAYAMTATNSPEFEILLKLLQTIDFDNLRKRVLDSE